MLYRAVLLLAAFETVFGGGAVAARHLMFRREEHEGAELKRRGQDATIETCGKSVTPDFIQSCVYTDCFRSDSAAPVGAPLHKDLTRRRLAGYTGPFPVARQEYLCPINPTAPGPGHILMSEEVDNKAKNCPEGDNRASESILKAYDGSKGGSQKDIDENPSKWKSAQHVCSYTSATPSGTVTGADNWGVSGSGVKCQCKTVRCRVITKDDNTVKENGQNQKPGQTACNFIVRIEDTHAVPSVPNWIMWVIFGLALVVAAVTSAFFICLYGSKAHSPEGGEEEGSNE